MLVLSRHRNEEIVIGEPPNQVVITVADIRGDKVRLGVTAPRAIPVHRREIYDKDKRSQTDQTDQTGRSDSTKSDSKVA